MKKRKSRKTLWTLLFILLNVAVIAYTAFKEFGGASAEPSGFRLAPRGALYLMGGLGCLALVLGAETAKYLLMMRGLGQRVSLKAAFETAALGKYYDCVTPSGAGGQPFQIYWMHRLGYPSGAATAMPITGFLTMQSGFILLAIVTFTVYRSAEPAAIRYTAYLGLLFYMLVPALLVVFSLSPVTAEAVVTGLLRLGSRLRLVKKPETLHDRIMTKLTEYHDSFGVLSGRWRLPTALVLLSVLFHAALCSIPYFALRALGGAVSYGGILAMTVYIYAAVTIVPTPGNSGAAEGSFYLIFSAPGISGVFWAMLIWRLLCYYSFILTGAVIHVVNAIASGQPRAGGSHDPV